MKIVLSVQPIKYPLTGIGRYTYELAQHLQNIPEIEEVLYFSENHFLGDLPKRPDHEEASKTTTSYIDQVKRVLARNKLIVDIYRMVKSKTKQDLFSDFDNYIYHGPNFYVPDFPGAKVVTIHDLSVFTLPQFHPRERVVYLGKEIEASIRKVDMIITDSDYIKEEIIAYLGVPETKIGVAKLACGDEFHPRSSQEAQQTLDKYKLIYQGYTLYTGTIEPRKNLSNLIQAYKRLTLQVRKRYPLVLAGYSGWNNYEIMEHIARGQQEGWIMHLGFVPNDHLPNLFAGARLFVFPSIYEGFGLPVLEAMASGIPVLTSNKSSLPEVGANAVLYAEPTDVEGMTDLIYQGIFDEEWRESAIQKGLNQSKRFSWQRCAEDVAAIYQLAHQQRS